MSRRAGRSTTKIIKALFFPTGAFQPETKNVRVYVPGAASPHIEENLILDEVLTPGNPTIQVYNTIMYTTDQQSRQIKFIAAYCYDKRLLKNQCLCGISCGVEWHGDLFVIKQSGSRYVSLEDAGEIEVAKAAIGKFLTVAAKAIETATPVKFPAEIDYDHEM